MKTAIAVLMMLGLAVCHVAADDPSPPPVSIESLISYLPKQWERERWKSYSEEERKSPEQAALAQKMKNISANCQQLQSRIIKGKPLSDYPGLLTLGTMEWKESTKTYRLMVEAPARLSQGAYGGFVCKFDQSFKIVSVSTVAYTL